MKIFQSKNPLFKHFNTLEKSIAKGIEKYYKIHSRNDDENSFLVYYSCYGIHVDNGYNVNFYQLNKRGFFQEFILNELEMDDKSDILTFLYVQMNKDKKLE